MKQIYVDLTKSIYLPGMTIELINMVGEKLPSGLRGQVSHVDDIGTVHVQWDNGSRLGLVGEDAFSIIKDIRFYKALHQSNVFNYKDLNEDTLELYKNIGYYLYAYGKKNIIKSIEENIIEEGLLNITDYHINVLRILKELEEYLITSEYVIYTEKNDFQKVYYYRANSKAEALEKHLKMHTGKDSYSNVKKIDEILFR